MERPSRYDAISKDDFLKFVAKMKGVFPQNYFIPTTASANEWYKALREYTLAQLTAAFETYIKINTNPPSVAELRNIIKSAKVSTEFNEVEYWGEHTYWVLTDLDGHILNECITESPIGADEVRAWFAYCGYEMSGTVIKPMDYHKYRPKYRQGGRPTVTKEEVQKAFKGIDVEVER